ncbi:hypothetical protein I551_8854 [Mycobacterium ulcerans str. Harvey]|uniref:Uncharacterized protein n=1 Tax=Mycobacterium ulcerans str. Harvey TaxID=1299332 RepID=A0ABN0R9W0_MYCUL|nr:hypothetical protein I551_8854 [Mycobacterium ulcerans str. Harvey]
MRPGVPVFLSRKSDLITTSPCPRSAIMPSSVRTRTSRTWGASGRADLGPGRLPRAQVAAA